MTLGLLKDFGRGVATGGLGVVDAYQQERRYQHTKRLQDEALNLAKERAGFTQQKWQTELPLAIRDVLSRASQAATAAQQARLRGENERWQREQQPGIRQREIISRKPDIDAAAAASIFAAPEASPERVAEIQAPSMTRQAHLSGQKAGFAASAQQRASLRAKEQAFRMQQNQAAQERGEALPHRDRDLPGTKMLQQPRANTGPEYEKRVATNALSAYERLEPEERRLPVAVSAWRQARVLNPQVRLQDFIPPTALKDKVRFVEQVHKLQQQSQGLDPAIVQELGEMVAEIASTDDAARARLFELAKQGSVSGGVAD